MSIQAVGSVGDLVKQIILKQGDCLSDMTRCFSNLALAVQRVAVAVVFGVVFREVASSIPVKRTITKSPEKGTSTTVKCLIVAYYATSIFALYTLYRSYHDLYDCVTNALPALEEAAQCADRLATLVS